MSEVKANQKIIEARYFIYIPLLITLVCAWLDIWSAQTANKNFNETVVETIKTVAVETGNGVVSVSLNTGASGVDTFISIVRCAAGYLVPSLLSIVIALIWQRIFYKDDDELCNIEKNRVGVTVTVTVIFTVVFVSCLIQYNLASAIVLCIVSVFYILFLLFFALDKRLLHKPKSKMELDELLLCFLEKTNK